MSFPGGIQFTNSGLLLSSKTLIGKQLIFTRIAVGDGELGGQSPLELTALIHPVMSIGITKMKVVNGTEAVLGGNFSNQGLEQGFWWREVGIYAQDPDTLQEKLYSYGNAGVLADYISAGGGAEILEKQLDITVMVAEVANISAQINGSLIYVTAQDLIDHQDDPSAHGATPDAQELSVVMRDADGRAKIAAPQQAEEIARKDTVDSAALDIARALSMGGML